MKIVSVFGTRPEAIKMSPLLKILETVNEITSIICITTQHREMLKQVLDLFEIVPNYNLNIMKENQDLYYITSKVLLGFNEILKKEKPDLVLVQGDTTTTMTASLSAFYQKILVGHIEAGLRTYNRYAPYPEEVNRRITSVIAGYHFAPTKIARNNLIKEGVERDKIYVTGNTVVDALTNIIKKINTSTLQDKFNKMFNFLDKKKRLVLITGHRRESFGEGFINICSAIKELALKFSDCEFLYPVHLNPNVQSPVREILGKGDLPNIYLIKPLEYLPFVYLMNRAYLIITDSGGIQEEAPSLGKPVLVTRNITERPEGVKTGIVKLVGNNKENIVVEASLLLKSKDEYKKMSNKKNPYGDGRASERIVKIILKNV